MKLSLREALSRGLFITLFLILKLVLDYIYVAYIADEYYALHYTININYLKYFESNILVILGAALIPQKPVKVSDILLVFYFVFPVLCMLSLYGLRNEPRIYTYFTYLSFLIIYFVSKLKSIKIRIPIVKNGLGLALFFSLFIVFITTIWILLKMGFNYFSLSLVDVYSYRGDINEAMFGGFFGYLVVWTTKVFTIFILTYGLHNKKHVLTLFSIILSIMLFGLTSHKAVAFYPLLIFFVFLFINKKTRFFYFPLATITFILITYSLTYFLDYDFIFKLIVRRIFYLPSHINYTYYEFFSTKDLVLLSNTIINPITDYPFTERYTLLVGQYLGNPNMSANTGFIATSYMHLGYFGMFIFSIIVGFILKLIDDHSQELPLWMSTSIVIVPIFTLFLSADLTTAFLTHGVLVSLSILIMIRKKQTT